MTLGARPLVVCGALRAEVERLVAERGWDVDPTYLDACTSISAGSPRRSRAPWIASRGGGRSWSTAPATRASIG
jgi:hypothetical protein